MHDPGIIESFFLIFSGAAVFAALALYTRQPMLIAYILLGLVLGPHALGWVSDAKLLSEIAEFGIIFLLFLVGLDLKPSRLRNMLGESLLTGALTTLLFCSVGTGVMLAFGFSIVEALITGIAVSFSSTLMGIKLLPTTVLHHRHIGEMVVSLLLIQDLVAIIALVVIAGYGDSVSDTIANLGQVLIALPLLVLAAWAGVRWLLMPLLRRFDAFNEFIFLLALGWCLGLASGAHYAGLSFEIGAFVAGVSLASTPVSPFIVDNLRPLRDFFLVLFFFSVGAGIDTALMSQVLLPVLVLAVLLVALKPIVFAVLLKWQREDPDTSWEVGFRLGQASEFSLLLSYVATSAALLSIEAAYVIQGATVLTLVLSSYLVIFRYPSPIAPSAKLRRD